MAPLPPPPPPPPRGPRVAPAPGAPSLPDTEDRIVRVDYDHEASRWGVGDALLSMLLFFVASAAVGILAFGFSEGDALDGAWLPVAIGVPPLIQLGHLTWLARARGRGLGPDFRLLFRPRDLATGIGSWLAGLILAGIVASIILALTDDSPSAAAAELAQESGEEGGLTVWIVVFAVLGATLIPLVEELVYRGLWWSALEKRGMPPVGAYLVTSAIFAMVHLELLRTPVLLVLGLAIGLGRLVTGRIGASVVAHVLVNAIGMIAVLADIA
jgi:membrane protease YdiL (CAAX protease family)